MTGHRKKRLELTTEIYEKITFRRNSGDRTFCEICKRPVQTFSRQNLPETCSLGFEEAGLLFTDRRIHSVGIDEMICGQSLAEYFLGYPSDADVTESDSQV